ncbi:MAG: B12-binding domain-containing radical SAM protein [Nitrospirae bacterium]|nr:B12-binding domain-containing radical SAM protein [Nitrospirota bacterium]
MKNSKVSSNKILLIRPQNVYNYNNYPPLNLISIGSALRKAGYDVEIINTAFEKDHLQTISDKVKGALFAGIALLTSEAPDAYRIMKHIKKQSQVPVVVGGWHCTLFPEQMAASEYVDFVVAGEGEEHIVNIAEKLYAGELPDKRIYSKAIADIEALPLTDYNLDPMIERFIGNYLTDKLSEYVRQPMRWLPYESSRGCPSHCTFCINVVSDNTRYRKKSAGKVIAEIEHIVGKYNITHLKIVDDNFFVDIKRVREICEGIINKKLNITWDGECRCDYFNDTMLNDETLSLCKRSGLIQLTLGIESGSPHTLKLMKKGITPEQAENAVKKCNDHGIIARSSFILEIPGEGIDDIKQTISFINRLRKYPYFTCGVGTFRPYPKCELTENLLKEGYLKEPTSFVEWTDKCVIDMYTSAEYIRPWQVNGKYSESAAYYLNMESAVRLGNHQIDRSIDRIKNNVFISLAKIRNKQMFYGTPFDKFFYKNFLTSFYKRRQDMEKSGSYPLSQIGGKDKSA